MTPPTRLLCSPSLNRRDPPSSSLKLKAGSPEDTASLEVTIVHSCLFTNSQMCTLGPKEPALSRLLPHRSPSFCNISYQSLKGPHHPAKSPSIWYYHYLMSSRSLASVTGFLYNPSLLDPRHPQHPSPSSSPHFSTQFPGT